MAVDSTAHQSSSNLDAASFSQNTPRLSVRESISGQRLQYHNQRGLPSRVGPISEPDNIGGQAGLRSDDRFTGDEINYFPAYPESGVAFAPGASDSQSIAVNYFPTYPDSGGVFLGEAPLEHVDTGCTTGAVNYFPTYPESNGVFTA